MPFSPKVAGHLSPGRDLDVFIILNNADLTAYMTCLSHIQKSCALRQHSILVFRHFADVPLLLHNSEKTKLALVHLMVYPDIKSALMWEKHFILSSFMLHFKSWCKSNTGLVELKRLIQPEPLDERIAYYRNHLYGALHIAMMGKPDRVTALNVFHHRLRYVARYVLYEAVLRRGGDPIENLIQERLAVTALNFSLDTSLLYLDNSRRGVDHPEIIEELNLLERQILDLENKGDEN